MMTTECGDSDCSCLARINFSQNTKVRAETCKTFENKSECSIMSNHDRAGLHQCGAKAGLTTY